jgi:hypothetical protein
MSNLRLTEELVIRDSGSSHVWLVFGDRQARSTEPCSGGASAVWDGMWAATGSTRRIHFEDRTWDNPISLPMHVLL